MKWMSDVVVLDFTAHVQNDRIRLVIKNLPRFGRRDTTNLVVCHGGFPAKSIIAMEYNRAHFRGKPPRLRFFMGNAAPGMIAAVDLSSNSFHMVVAKTNEDSFHVVDRMRGMVQLAAGLDQDNNITDKAIEQAIECLEQFGERLSDLPQLAVRAVGTNTLRKARNALSFLSQAETALGHAIDIISGHEEARVIYLGVSHGLDDESDLRLVMDIGGGSTEFILGRRFDPLYMESRHMGCVSLSDTFFADGSIDNASMGAAEIVARQELETMQESFRRVGWHAVIGASDTILSIRDIVLVQQWSEEGITRDALANLRQAMIKSGYVDKLDFKGLPDERRPVFPGGVAILIAAFQALGIERMRVSDGALREGLLYDLLGRLHREDVRERTVNELTRRYQIDLEQGERVRLESRVRGVPTYAALGRGAPRNRPVDCA